jgi:hypothetical protein
LGFFAAPLIEAATQVVAQLGNAQIYIKAVMGG